LLSWWWMVMFHNRVFLELSNYCLLKEDPTLWK
jgi:hypothetical protein